MRKDEVEMAEFLESLKAPQSRRIIESLVVESMTIEALGKKSKLSVGSIGIHIQPLLDSGLVTLTSKKEYRLNRSKFNRCQSWFTSLTQSQD
jgi:DNA-binding transcriptional ArsR family regulator